VCQAVFELAFMSSLLTVKVLFEEHYSITTSQVLFELSFEYLSVKLVVVDTQALSLVTFPEAFELCTFILS
jgi:hypothetical protein